MEGWITLHRKLQDWEWYTAPNHVFLFVHLLLKANHKGGKWRGHEYKRGDVLTSLSKLAEETGLSRQNIRTILKNLAKTGEVNTLPNTKLTHLSVCKYDTYQSDKDKPNTPTNTELTRSQHSPNTELTTNNNDNNKKNVKNENKEEVDQVLKHLNEKLGKRYRTAKGLLKRFSEGYSVEDAIKVIDNKIEEWGEDQKMKVYLTPDTLFSEKFDKYLNQEPTTPTTDQPEIFVI